ncbi:hypothetical protein GCM10010260_82660 [Streptomyces filipinensis]|uniref:Peptidase A1 domain-containing protein n=1 Tax=Streptomyces filipinensis TaxID=66887 RepID=A0A918IKB9_9ACTN|nr:pepsin-like aspartyl protease [Streptomyces filipinensis]GGV29573.1 hypothetical protein GCM10010260_82660 [Streptomyces filipinensis]
MKKIISAAALAAAGLSLAAPAAQAAPAPIPAAPAAHAAPVAFGDETTEFEATGAILDTGTSLITLPSEYAEMLNSMLNSHK